VNVHSKVHVVKTVIQSGKVQLANSCYLMMRIELQVPTPQSLFMLLGVDNIKLTMQMKVIMASCCLLITALC